MSVKDLLLQNKGKVTPTTNTTKEDIEESGSDFWGIERVANRHAIMLDLRLKGGLFYAFPYSYLTKIKFNPSEGIELFISGNHVKITGRNLNEIYIQLCKHRVSYIQANISDIDITDENEVFIKDIEVLENAF